MKTYRIIRCSNWEEKVIATGLTKAQAMKLWEELLPGSSERSLYWEEETTKKTAR